MGAVSLSVCRKRRRKVLPSRDGGASFELYKPRIISVKGGEQCKGGVCHVLEYDTFLPYVAEPPSQITQHMKKASNSEL